MMNYIFFLTTESYFNFKQSNLEKKLLAKKDIPLLHKLHLPYLYESLNLK